jgi:hypothetical protein
MTIDFLVSYGGSDKVDLQCQVSGNEWVTVVTNVTIGKELTLPVGDMIEETNVRGRHYVWLRWVMWYGDGGISYSFSYTVYIPDAPVIWLLSPGTESFGIIWNGAPSSQRVTVGVRAVRDVTVQCRFSDSGS